MEGRGRLAVRFALPYRSATMVPRSRWLRFSLRTGAVLITIVCVLLATLGRRAQRIVAQKRAVEAIVAAGGYVITDSENGDALFSAPAWKLALGFAPVPKVTEASFASSSADAATIHKAMPSLAALPDLREVEVRNLLVDFDFDDTCAAYLGSLNELEELWLCGGKNLTATGFRHLLRPKLKVICLDEANLRGLVLPASAWPKYLETVFLEECQHLSGQAFAQMLQPGLIQISADATEFTDDDLADVQAPPSLEEVHLTNAKQLSARGLTPLLGSGLEDFFLEGADLTDADVQSLPLPSSLDSLCFAPCERLTNASVQHIVTSCPKLGFLSLGSLALDDSVVEILAGPLKGTNASVYLSSPGLSVAALEKLSAALGPRSTVQLEQSDGGHIRFEKGEITWPFELRTRKPPANQPPPAQQEPAP